MRWPVCAPGQRPALRAVWVPAFLVVFFAVLRVAAAFLAVPRWAGVAFLGEVARCTRPAVRFVAAATFFPARPVVPLAGVDLVAVVVAVVFAAVLLPAVAVFFAGLVFLAGLVFAAGLVLRAVAVAFLAGVVLRAVAVVLRAAGLVFLAAAFFAVGLVLRAVGLVFFVAGFFAAVADVFRADVFFAAGLVLRAAVFVVAVLDARRVAGRVAALVPATMTFSSLRTFNGFVPYGDNGVSGPRPRYGRTGLALLPGPAGVLGLPLLIALRHPLQRLLSFGLRGVGTEPVLGGTQVRPGLHALMTKTPEVLATRSAVAHENTVHGKTAKRHRFAQNVAAFP